MRLLFANRTLYETQAFLIHGKSAIHHGITNRKIASTCWLVRALPQPGNITHPSQNNAINSNTYPLMNLCSMTSKSNDTASTKAYSGKVVLSHELSPPDLTGSVYLFGLRAKVTCDAVKACCGETFHKAQTFASTQSSRDGKEKTVVRGDRSHEKRK